MRLVGSPALTDRLDAGGGRQVSVSHLAFRPVGFPFVPFVSFVVHALGKHELPTPPRCAYQIGCPA